MGMSTAVERRRAHRILARALADQPDRQAWHLAEATVAPDEQVAVLLERTAQASLRRGDAPGAVRALTRAAELSPRRPDRGRRLVEAACIGAEATGQLTSEAQLLADARQAGPQSTGSLQAAITVAHLLLNAGCDIDSAHRYRFGAPASGRRDPGLRRPLRRRRRDAGGSSAQPAHDLLVRRQAQALAATGSWLRLKDGPGYLRASGRPAVGEASLRRTQGRRAYRRHPRAAPAPPSSRIRNSRSPRSPRPA